MRSNSLQVARNNLIQLYPLPGIASIVLIHVSYSTASRKTIINELWTNQPKVRIGPLPTSTFQPLYLSWII